METATLVDHEDLQTKAPTQSLENNAVEDPYSGLKKLVQAAQTQENGSLLHNNHFDRHIETHGHQPPHWIAWLKTV